ncbi:MAG: sigma-54 dependent transcriptional regulator [Polyangiales bacterium]
MARVLLVDDEENLRLALKTYLRKQGYDVVAAADVEAALGECAKDAFDFVITDVRMPGRSGLELLAELRAKHPATTVIVMSAYGSIDQALDAIRSGAYDYVAKPFKPEELGFVLKKAEEREALRRQNRELRAAMIEAHQFEELLGRSEAMKLVFNTVAKVAPFKTTVLITGESGTGKELVARAIHRRSPRANKNFVTINCGAIPETLLESELFGHKRGAFTDANQDKKGLFEEADGATLFLDEVGELPLSLQVKLLRVLQEGTFRRLGETQDRKCDVRVIAATLRDLQADVKNGRFREDLFYRLNVLNVGVPPLRQRREDVPLLVDHFIHRYNAKLGTKVTGLDPQASKVVYEYNWPGNVRELENTVERAMVLADAPVLRVADLPERLREPQDPVAAELAKGDLSVKRTTRVIEEILIRRALERTKGNRTRAADLLEISHRALLYKIKEYGIS